LVRYLDPGILEFDAVIQRSDVRNSSAFIPIPGDTNELFGTSGRVPVSATFDGIPYRGSIVRMRGPALLLVLQDTLTQLAKGPGDCLHVTLQLDTQPRIVELDPDIESGLRDAGEFDSFRALAYTHQRQFVLWISEAKRPETRATRIGKTAEMVKAKQTRN
jgi:Domain of unknown function (DUF1905)/Bacteriocin-protection, YdeI or OmpD-Associated